jgi:dUTP pyrophosphatase
LDGKYEYDYLYPSETKVFKTGFAVQIPEGYELQIRCRSGYAASGILLSNGVGTIDCDYRGEVGIILTNTSPNTFKISTGDRIAQCLLVPVEKFEFMPVSELDTTERGEGGYGSTGR